MNPRLWMQLSLLLFAGFTGLAADRQEAVNALKKVVYSGAYSECERFSRAGFEYVRIYIPEITLADMPIVQHYRQYSDPDNPGWRSAPMSDSMSHRFVEGALEYAMWSGSFQDLYKIVVIFEGEPATMAAEFKSIQDSGDGTVQLNLGTEPGKGYSVEASSNLVEWNEVANITATDTESPVTVTKENTTGTTVFRAVSQ